MAAMFTVYGMSDSGNCYKVRLALEQLVLPSKRSRASFPCCASILDGYP